ncbi:hypothetical protein MKW94_010404 [Papaver nudicaule]|uniref:Uncharacterized protein n=1 Tax=Papaver nudicaule TaxID=74823 RepID=A0AA41RZ26_PAPNU|nr:hypothetical protein [Papaver nudicaule]
MKHELAGKLDAGLAKRAKRERAGELDAGGTKRERVGKLNTSGGAELEQAGKLDAAGAYNHQTKSLCSVEQNRYKYTDMLIYAER